MQGTPFNDTSHSAMNSPLAIIILAAGHGTRMNSNLPKVLHAVGGLPMLGHVHRTAHQLGAQSMTVVIGDHSEQVQHYAEQLDPAPAIAVQSPPLGTGHAVAQALPYLDEFSGTVLILYADTPLISGDILKALINEVSDDNPVAVLGFRPNLEHAYGRLITDESGQLLEIVEARDASPEQLMVNFCNSGVMAVTSSFLRKAVPNLSNDNAKGEYYLTDLVGMARQAGHRCSAIEADETDVMGIDSRSDLAVGERIFQDRKRDEALRGGATLIDPHSTFFSFDTRLGRDVIIGPMVIFGPGVEVADHVTIHACSHLEGTRIDSGASVGPFARLRPGAELGRDVKVGNFVEIKKTTLARGAKVSHLTYLGDASIGEEANIGAGTITCNYDGFGKFKTTIGDNAFIGSNSALVAPVTIGKSAYVGSGSVVTKNVPADSLAVARGRQTIIENWAAKFRAKQEK